MSRITARHRIETGLAPAQPADMLAGEQSSGTFVKVPGETDELRERFGVRVDRVQVLGHLDGTAAGVASGQQAWDLALRGTAIEEQDCARLEPERAIDQYGQAS